MVRLSLSFHGRSMPLWVVHTTAPVNPNWNNWNLELDGVYSALEKAHPRPTVDGRRLQCLLGKSRFPGHPVNRPDGRGGRPWATLRLHLESASARSAAVHTNRPRPHRRRPHRDAISTHSGPGSEHRDITATVAVGEDASVALTAALRAPPARKGPALHSCYVPRNQDPHPPPACVDHVGAPPTADCGSSVAMTCSRCSSSPRGTPPRQDGGPLVAGLGLLAGCSSGPTSPLVSTAELPGARSRPGRCPRRSPRWCARRRRSGRSPRPSASEASVSNPDVGRPRLLVSLPLPRRRVRPHGQGAVELAPDPGLLHRHRAAAGPERPPIPNLGQGAFQTDNGSTVVRKDWKILTVDISGLPAQFGKPPTSRGDVAVTVADLILACWAGD